VSWGSVPWRDGPTINDVCRVVLPDRLRLCNRFT
jgi:hypothetical protein